MRGIKTFQVKNDLCLCFFFSFLINELKGEQKEVFIHSQAKLLHVLRGLGG